MRVFFQALGLAGVGAFVAAAVSTPIDWGTAAVSVATALGIGAAAAAPLYGLRRQVWPWAWAASSGLLLGGVGLLLWDAGIGLSRLGHAAPVAIALVAAWAPMAPVTKALASPTWKDGRTFFFVTLCFLGALATLASLRNDASPDKPQTLLAVGSLCCGAGILSALGRGLQRARQRHDTDLRQRRSQDFAFGPYTMPLARGAWVLRLIFGGVSAPALILLLIFAASYADATSATRTPFPAARFVAAFMCGSVAFMSSLIAFRSSRSGSWRVCRATGFADLNHPKRTALAIAVSCVSWPALFVVVGGEYHLRGLALALAALVGALAAEAIVFDVAVLQLVSINWTIAGTGVLGGVGAGSTVYWLVGAGIWGHGRVEGALPSAALALISLALLCIALALCGSALARPMPTPHVTRDPAWHNVVQDQFLYAILAAVFVVAPIYIISRTRSPEVGLQLAGLGVVVTAFWRVIDLNRAHRRSEEEGSPSEGLKPRTSDSALRECLEMRRLRRLRWHHWIQNSLAIVVVAVMSAWTVGQLLHRRGLGVLAGVLVIVWMALDNDSPTVAWRRLVRGLNLFQEDVRRVRRGSNGPERLRERERCHGDAGPGDDVGPTL